MSPCDGNPQHFHNFIFIDLFKVISLRGPHDLWRYWPEWLPAAASLLPAIWVLPHHGIWQVRTFTVVFNLICCSGQRSRRAETGVWQNSIPSVLSGKLWVLTYFLLWYYLLVQAKSSLYHLQYYRLHRPARSRQGQDLVVPHDEDHHHDQHVGVVRAGEPLLHPCLDHQHPGCLLYCLPLHTQQVIVLYDYLSINS